MYKNICQDTQDLITRLNEVVAKKQQGVEKKLARLEKDVTAAKQAKLSKTVVARIQQEIKEGKRLQKELGEAGLVSLLEQEREKLRKSQIKLSKTLFAAIDALIAKGFNKSVFKELQKLTADFNQQEKKQDKDAIALAKANPKTSPEMFRALSGVEELHRENIFFTQMLANVSAVKVSPQDNLKASNEYPMKKERAHLALACIKTSRSELSGAYGFLDDEAEKMSMLAMFVGDAHNHYALGVELLNGHPVRIETARQMDTASRDGIADDVWDFVTETICDGKIFGHAAVKKHRAKVQLQEAQRENKLLHKVANTNTSAAPQRAARKL